METFFRFIASPAGRWTHALAGGTLLTAGLLQGRKGLPLAAAGLVPLAAGAFDLCLLAPLTGLPLQGEALRQQLNAAAR